MKLSIFIPCYNEKHTIEKIIQQINEVAIPCEKELIIVDDGSTDGTVEILETIQKKYNFMLLTHTSNQGRGAALKTAMEYLNGEFTIIQDGDLEYSPNDYPALLENLLNGKSDVVYGSRFLNQTSWHGYKINYFYNKAISAIVRSLTKLPITDAMSGYKLFKTDLLKQTILHENRFGIDLELVCKVTAKNKERFSEVAIQYRPRTYDEGKKIGISDALNMFWFLIKFNMLNNKHLTKKSNF